jgi:hypothetical protein
MLEGILVTLGSARRFSAVQSASAVRHRGRLAPVPSPRPRPASAAEVHKQFALHGVDPQVSRQPLPPGLRPCRRQLDRPNARGRAPPSPFAGPCRGAGSERRAAPCMCETACFSWVSSRGAATVSAADRAHQAGSVNALLSRCGGRKEKARRDAGLLAHGRRSICGGIPPATSR